MDFSIAEERRSSLVLGLGQNQDLFTAKHAEKNFCLAFLGDLCVLGGKTSG
jgi:hypothetical protein